MNLRGIDLNLLVILDALLREGGVTGAARRLNLTQPAVSVALSRARALFRDPILVRSGAAMRPTPLAEALAPRLAEALAGVATLFQTASFDPTTSSRSFLLTTSDLAELLLLTGLVATIRSAAPNLSLTLRSVDGLQLTAPAAREGRIDLTIGGMPRPDGPFEDEVLFDDEFVILARNDHPAFQHGEIDLAAFAALPQALVAPQGRVGGGPIDSALAGFGLQRFIALNLTHFAALPGVLAHSDLVACLPRTLTTVPGFRGAVTTHDLPFPSPRYSLRMVWHRRHDADPGHLWLRDRVRQAALAPGGNF
jgi:DNA-binding transcriptional LysR family regulator